MPEDSDVPLPRRAVVPSATARYFKECVGEKDFDLLAQALLTPPKYTALRVSRGMPLMRFYGHWIMLWTTLIAG